MGTDIEWLYASAGQRSVTAIKTDGTMWSLGDNQWGALGPGGTRFPPSQFQDIGLPLQVEIDTGSNSDWAFVDLGASGSDLSLGGRTSAAAIKTDGTLWTWGSDAQRALGRSSGSNGDPNSFSDTPALRDVGVAYRYINRGGLTGYGITTGGRVRAWGSHTEGQAGVGSGTSAPVPTTLFVNGDEEIVLLTVVGGTESVLAVGPDFDNPGPDVLIGWGEGGLRQLGVDGDSIGESSGQVKEPAVIEDAPTIPRIEY